MRIEVKNVISLMIVIRAKLEDQMPFYLRSPFNSCRYCEIVFAIKFYVVDAQSRIRCIVMEMIVVKIKCRLIFRT